LLHLSLFLHDFRLLLLLKQLILFNPLNELVWVSHDLRDEVLLVIVLQVEYFLQVFVVLPRHVLYIGQQVLILQIHTPIQLVIILLLQIRGRGVLLRGLRIRGPKTH
jgi:hypothetical protein